MNKETEQEISELQTIEQNLQRFLSQKQQFQTQIVEIDTALKELPESGDTYKIIGNIMVAVKKTDLEEDLKSKKEIVELRLKSIEKQEQKMRQDADSLQKQIMDKIKKKK
ncbi:MAG: prefoldin subunit [Nanoarchaeota archaeon]|nr:prefoldin subunit [Nanoarchaeota archaeon]MBU1269418.1 prefoldin subunit [Nanoarchaeota archaeon]MBU1603707.1 prefoldin subunit [Nanoarchaeota archaeon]MBU2442944.1 prefoldin subunit [Nanoarchaeota archaeon]